MSKTKSKKKKITKLENDKQKNNKNSKKKKMETRMEERFNIKHESGMEGFIRWLVLMLPAILRSRVKHGMTFGALAHSLPPQSLNHSIPI